LSWFRCLFLAHKDRKAHVYDRNKGLFPVFPQPLPVSRTSFRQMHGATEMTLAFFTRSSSMQEVMRAISSEDERALDI
jgi:hypothetical protein